MEDPNDLVIGPSKSGRDLLERVLYKQSTVLAHEVAHLTTLRNQIVHTTKAWTLVEPLHVSQFVCGSSRFSTVVQTAQLTVSPLKADPLYCYTDYSGSAASNGERGRRGFRGFQSLRRRSEFTLNPRKEWLKIVRLLNRLISRFIRLLDDTISLRDFVVRLRPFHLVHGAHPPDVSTSLTFSFSA